MADGSLDLHIYCLKLGRGPAVPLCNCAAYCGHLHVHCLPCAAVHMAYTSG